MASTTKQKPVMGGEPVVAIATLVGIALAAFGIAVDSQTLVIIVTAVVPVVASFFQRAKVKPVTKTVPL